MKQPGNYVLVSPVKNEETWIGTTIDCVVHQTVGPAEWVIVSDGSTDRTDALVKSAALAHPWIHLLSLPPRVTRSFAAVVHAAEAGIRALTVDHFEYIGLLDSDVRFQPDYFERVIESFVASPRLGLAGGVVVDVGLPRHQLPRNRQDVPGAVQFFRRPCFAALGGLLPVAEGGWDGLSCARARMLGFETRLLTHLVVDHLKPRNSSEGGVLRRHWQMGIRDYAVGYAPLFEMCKCLGRLREAPLLVGSLAWFAGYCSGVLRRRPRIVPPALLAFLREEQKRRLLATLSLILRPEGRSQPQSSPAP